MKQPKVYVKKLDKVFDVLEIHFDIDVVYFNDGRSSEYMSVDFEDVEFIYNTGYKDMNGNYIFNGDVLVYQGETNKFCINKLLVEKDGEQEFYYLTNNGNFVSRLMNMDDYEVVGNIYEVIGNICENKDLLED